MQNETPSELAVNVKPPNPDSILALLTRLDALVWPGAFCVFVGWFFLDTLRISAGPIHHGVPFYDIPAIIGRPMRMLTGVDHSHLFGTILFGLVCAAALAAPFAPVYWKDRRAWFGYLAPLVLLLCCVVMLYARTSGEFWATSNDPAAMSNDVIRFANDLIHRGGDIAARRVSIAAGGYLAFAGCVFLALRGIQRYRKATDVPRIEP